MLGHDELERRLGFHPGTAATAPLYEMNRAAALELAGVWDRSLPPGRELAEALTCLQQALMWANAAVATNLAPLGPERGAQHPAGAVQTPDGATHVGVVPLEAAVPACTCAAADHPELEHALDCPRVVTALEVTDGGRC